MSEEGTRLRDLVGTLPEGAIGATVQGTFYSKEQIEAEGPYNLSKLFADAGWLEIHVACQAALALQERDGKMAAQYLTQLRGLPESRSLAMVIAKLNTIMDKIHEEQDKPVERLPFRRRQCRA